MSDKACCAHMTVKYQTQTTDNLTRGWWECKDCQYQFEPVQSGVRLRALEKAFIEHGVSKTELRDRLERIETLLTALSKPKIAWVATDPKIHNGF